jgi:glycosyltransferase involved in cell wall biosynthesis
MIKILHIIRMLSRGGASYGMMNTAKHTSASGDFFHSVITLVDSEVDARNLAAKAGVIVINNPGFKEICQEIKNADIVQIHFWNSPEMYSFLKSDLPEMRLLIRFNVNGHHAPLAITDDLIECADYVLASNPFVYEAPAFKRFSNSEIKSKSSLLYATTDFSKFKNFTPVKHTGFNVGYLGTVDFIKMHPDYISLCSQINIPEVRFIVCGTGSDLAGLKAEATEKSISDKFQFKGFVDDIQSAYAEFDVFGYPLCEDNFSTVEFVLQEAMYLGIPPVIFSYGGAQKTVKHDHSGLIVNSKKEYIEAVEYLYHQPEERKRLGENAKKQVKIDFDTELSKNEYIDIYQKMIRNPKRQCRLTSMFQNEPSPLSIEWNKDLNRLGAESFIDSQKTAVPQFFDHLFGQEKNIVERAEKSIRHSSHLLHRLGILAYLDYFPNDVFLPFWSGLVNLEQEKFKEAFSDFKLSVKNGMEPARVEPFFDEISRRTDPSGRVGILTLRKQRGLADLKRKIWL